MIKFFKTFSEIIMIAERNSEKKKKSTSMATILKLIESKKKFFFSMGLAYFQLQIFVHKYANFWVKLLASFDIFICTIGYFISCKFA